MKTPLYFSKKDLNAPSTEEYEKWLPHICGICCLKSAGDFFGKTRHVSLYELTTRAIEHGVFVEDKKTGEISGAYHKPLVELAKSLGIQGKIERRLTSRRLVELLNNGNLVMLSIDKSKIDPKESGGHLILIHSFDPKREVFTLHDSKPILVNNGESVEINTKTLERISNKKGISLLDSPAPE